MQYNKEYRQSEHGRLIYQHHASLRRERQLRLDVQFTKEDALLVYQRFNNMCFNCGSTNHLQIDHHYPLARGYGLSLNNAVLLCRHCNVSKHDKIPEEFYEQNKLQELKWRLSLLS